MHFEREQMNESYIRDTPGIKLTVSLNGGAAPWNKRLRRLFGFE
jgi:hypothetical protein